VAVVAGAFFRAVIVVLWGKGDFLGCFWRTNRCSRRRPPSGLSCFSGTPAAGAAELGRSNTKHPLLVVLHYTTAALPRLEVAGTASSVPAVGQNRRGAEDDQGGEGHVTGVTCYRRSHCQ
jgi:hypothetical protein